MKEQAPVLEKSNGINKEKAMVKAKVADIRKKRYQATEDGNFDTDFENAEIETL